MLWVLFWVFLHDLGFRYLESFMCNLFFCVFIWVYVRDGCKQESLLHLSFTLLVHMKINWSMKVYPSYSADILHLDYCSLLIDLN